MNNRNIPLQKPPRGEKLREAKGGRWVSGTTSNIDIECSSIVNMWWKVLMGFGSRLVAKKERDCFKEQMSKTEKELLNQNTITIVKGMNKISVSQLEYMKIEKLFPCQSIY